MSHINPNGSGDHPPGGELTDEELDAMLAAADSEILEYVKATAHPEVGLLAMMTASKTDLPSEDAAEPSCPALGRPIGRAAAVIEMRSIARTLRHQLAEEEHYQQACAEALSPSRRISRSVKEAHHADTRAQNKAAEARRRADRAISSLQYQKVARPHRRFAASVVILIALVADALMGFLAAKELGHSSLPVTLLQAGALLALAAVLQTALQAVHGRKTWIWSSRTTRTIRDVGLAMPVYGLGIFVATYFLRTRWDTAGADAFAASLTILVLIGSRFLACAQTPAMRQASRRAREALQAAEAAEKYAHDLAALSRAGKLKPDDRLTLETLGVDGLRLLRDRVSMPIVVLAAALKKVRGSGLPSELAGARASAQALAAWAGNTDIDGLATKVADVVALLDACDITSLDDTVFRLAALADEFRGDPPADTAAQAVYLHMLVTFSAMAEEACDEAQLITSRLAAAQDYCPSQLLAAVDVDASGADLSDADVPDMEILEGVVWTAETTWPPDVARSVRALSDEIAPGIYKVRRGRAHDDAELATV